MNSDGLARIAGVELRRPRPQRVPDADLRLVIASLLEELAEHREALDRADRSGALRRAYERFVLALEESGFALDVTSRRFERAARERRLGELAEHRGDRQAAVAHYERALRARGDIGVRRRLGRLSEEPGRMERQEWEYRFITFERGTDEPGTDEHMASALNDWGRQGWEAISMAIRVYTDVDQVIVLFKRPRRSDAQDGEAAER